MAKCSYKSVIDKSSPEENEEEEVENYGSKSNVFSWVSIKSQHNNHDPRLKLIVCDQIALKIVNAKRVCDALAVLYRKWEILLSLHTRH